MKIITEAERTMKCLVEVAHRSAQPFTRGLVKGGRAQVLDVGVELSSWSGEVSDRNKRSALRKGIS
jgi:hypothetical protein